MAPEAISITPSRFGRESGSPEKNNATATKMTMVCLPEQRARHLRALKRENSKSTNRLSPHPTFVRTMVILWVAGLIVS
jgi:hypothetical protein